MSKVSRPFRPISPEHPVAIAAVGHDAAGDVAFTADSFYRICEWHEVPAMCAALREAARDAGAETFSIRLTLHGVLDAD